LAERSPLYVQLLSDLHLETEDFEPQPLPGAALLVLAGDIDATWAAYSRFAGWPVPVFVVPGNHEFDGRDLRAALPAFEAMCARHGLTLLHRRSQVVEAAGGRRLRLLGTPRWSDFDLFGPAQRERTMRAARYFLRLMGARRGEQPFDAPAVRDEGLACRAWLETELALPPAEPVDTTIVITHFAPSLASADPRYGAQPGTASFCNADDDLLRHADLWLHGHLHCRHDYRVPRPGAAPTRVVCQARGMADKGETEGFDAGKLIEVPRGAAMR
jgi:DNA repair exonuclease SbcCD nuclease subunit